MTHRAAKLTLPFVAALLLRNSVSASEFTWTGDKPQQIMAAYLRTSLFFLPANLIGQDAEPFPGGKDSMCSFTQTQLERLGEPFNQGTYEVNKTERNAANWRTDTVKCTFKRDPKSGLQLIDVQEEVRTWDRVEASGTTGLTASSGPKTWVLEGRWFAPDDKPQGVSDHNQTARNVAEAIKGRWHVALGFMNRTEQMYFNHTGEKAASRGAVPALRKAISSLRREQTLDSVIQAVQKKFSAISEVNRTRTQEEPVRYLPLAAVLVITDISARPGAISKQKWIQMSRTGDPPPVITLEAAVAVDDYQQNARNIVLTTFGVPGTPFQSMPLRLKGHIFTDKGAKFHVAVA